MSILISRLNLNDTSNLPTVDPNLMPFHIQHSGGAPISTFFLPKLVMVPVHDEKKILPEPVQDKEQVVEERQPRKEGEGEEGALLAGAPAPAPEADPIPDAPMEEMKETTGEAMEETTQESMEETTQETQETTKETQGATQETTQEITKAPTATPMTAEPEQKEIYEAAFRGRTMCGLRVALPAGYTGVVLKSQRSTLSASTSKAHRGDENGARSAKRRKVVGRAGAGKRVTRASSIAVEQELENAEEDEESGTNLVLVHNDDDEAEKGKAPQRVLKPVSTFSSMVIWSPDTPVDESQDVYVRSLVHWTSLAELIAQTEED